MHLFVYGTLRRGEGAHDRLQKAEYLGTDQTRPLFTLVNVGPYPGLLAGGTTAVTGELYHVPDALLPALDAYEGCPDDYRRVEIVLESGRCAQTYVMNEGAEFPVIASGDWAQRSR